MAPQGPPLWVRATMEDLEEEGAEQAGAPAERQQIATSAGINMTITRQKRKKTIPSTSSSAANASTPTYVEPPSSSGPIEPQTQETQCATLPVIEESTSPPKVRAMRNKKTSSVPVSPDSPSMSTRSKKRVTSTSPSMSTRSKKKLID
uniref:Uncharacterized protein n=1 Tax=Leersia perrieri TaxID=77586 RepID=A0A0D9X5K2_9ORYZ